MRKLMVAGALIVAAAAVACSKPAGEGAAPAAGGQAAEGRAATGAVAAATQAVQPRRKEGLWQLAINSSGGPGVTMNAQMCVDAGTADDFAIKQPGADECANTKISPSGNGWAFESVCKTRGMTMTTNGKVSGDMSSNYVMEASTTMDPPPSGMVAETKTRIHAKWLGACPAGMKPGSMKMGGMNIGG